MRSTTARKVAMAVAVERGLSFLDKFIDAAMILALILWGPVVCFAIGVILTLVFCLAVLEGELRFKFTGIEHMKEWAHAPTASKKSKPVSRWITLKLKALFRAMLRSYWLMLILGSVAYLEADYVTLLLKKTDETRRSVFLRVMLPSVVWGIGVWTLIYWGALEFALWLWVWVVGCTPSECLVKEDWRTVLIVLEWLERALT